MDKNKKFTIHCRAIIFHEGKLLTVRHTHERAQDNTALPGGHLEFGENIEQCLEREIIEELGIKPVLGRLLYVNTFVSDENQPFEFFIEVLNGADYVGLKDLKTSHAFEIGEICWVGKDDDIKILPTRLCEDLKKGELLRDTVRYIFNQPYSVKTE